MAETSYSACAMKPEEIVVCTALNTGKYTEEYAERVSAILADIKKDSLREKVRQTLGGFEDRDGFLAQSSPYRLVVLQQLFPEGKVLVSRPRLQTAKEDDPKFMSGHYIDCGLDLDPCEKGDYEINPVQATALRRDLSNIGANVKNARLIPYHILTCEVYGKSPDGLVFKLSEKGKDIAGEAILDTNDFKWDYKPSQSSLFRVYLDRDGDWFADDDLLANSNDDGRVVVETTGEAGSREFESLNAKATSLLSRQRAERETLAKMLLA